MSANRFQNLHQLLIGFRGDPNTLDRAVSTRSGFMAKPVAIHFPFQVEAIAKVALKAVLIQISMAHAFLLAATMVVSSLIGP